MQYLIHQNPLALVYCGVVFLIIFASVISNTKPVRWFIRKMWGEWGNENKMDL